MNTIDGAPPTASLAGRPVSRVGFGAMQLAERADRSPDAPVAVLRHAVELGINHIDTADFYGAGQANELIRSALHPYADDLVLVSKVGAEHDPEKGLIAAQRPGQLRAAVEANLQHLAVEQLTVVNLRRMDTAPGILASGADLVDLDSQLAELAALRDEGKIGGIGLSNVSIGQLRQALPVGLACVQNHYNVLERSAEPLLALCAEHELAWVPFFPLGSAFAAMESVTAQPAVLAIARALDITPAQVGLAWLLNHDPNVLLIPGTANVDHLAENVAAGRIALDADTMIALDGLSPVG